ncbi:hypothetical protein EUGRSUZ_B00882 [Eucalyptus grandis]|uniref:Uncharacterized protein n=1 Tax=Eucalyptus grandis TaxID=71139 RepID=A0ACC3LNY0_EUCGR|nr:hypothetical protein EUGRSUZ_B00882 [Eucalyptus grandis]
MASRDVVSFVGLSELSLEMAASLLQAGYKVQALQQTGPLMDAFVKLGGSQCNSPIGGGKALIVLISHDDDINNLFFSSTGACKELERDTVVILHSNILPSHLQKIEKCLTENAEVFVVDAYVSRGTFEHLSGKLVISSSGKSDAIAMARPILSAMSDKLYIFDGEIGAGRNSINVSNCILDVLH